MKKAFQQYRIIGFIFTGFLTGLFFSIIYYYSLFNVSGKGFSFSNLIYLHKQNFASLFFDILPFLGLFAGYFYFTFRKSNNQKLQKLVANESVKTEKAIGIAKELSEGKFKNLRIENPEQNELLYSLEQLKKRLIENNDIEAKRKNEDKQRNRISEGLAMFGDILREQSEDINNLAYELIRNLIRYLDANQGGFFITETNEEGKKYLNLLSSYAYDRKKFADKKISWGEGIIGTCAVEQKKVYMTDIPDSYLTITSGLGRSNPKNLLIVPLIHKNETKGIIELASFQEFKDFEIDFVEKVAESTAMTIENINNSIRTSKLLEETREQTKELSIHEEKMRQSLEELKATQEQAAQQAEKFISFTNSVNHTMIRADFDVNGILLYANTKFLRKLGYAGNKEVEGKHISMFINEKDREWFNGIWK
ncbi:MAG: GAF domain-containing protein, partial [Bacteroidales bacterium]|nr:GAF domain-containing protein [Bacteroidales bacterium]